MVGYVYRITNIQTQKTYVGITEDFERRKKQHIKALNNNTHHSPKLQEAWNRWGESNFEWLDLFKSANMTTCIPSKQRKLRSITLSMMDTIVTPAVVSLTGSKR